MIPDKQTRETVAIAAYYMRTSVDCKQKAAPKFNKDNNVYRIERGKMRRKMSRSRSMQKDHIVRLCSLHIAGCILYRCSANHLFPSVTDLGNLILMQSCRALFTQPTNLRYTNLIRYPHGVCEFKINCSSFLIKCAPAKRTYISRDLSIIYRVT